MHRRRKAPEHNILADITQFVRMNTWNRHLAGRVTEFTNHSAANLRLISLTALPAHNKHIFLYHPNTSPVSSWTQRRGTAAPRLPLFNGLRLVLLKFNNPHLLLRLPTP